MRNVEIRDRSKNLVAYQLKPFATFQCYQFLQRTPSQMWQSSWIRLWKLRHARKLVWFCVKTNRFSFYFEMLPPLSKSLCFPLLLFTVWRSTFDQPYGCYHYFVFMDLVNGYSKSKLIVKKQVPLKNKIRFGYVFCNFCYGSFLLWSIFSPLADVQC